MHVHDTDRLQLVLGKLAPSLLRGEALLRVNRLASLAVAAALAVLVITESIYVIRVVTHPAPTALAPSGAAGGGVVASPVVADLAAAHLFGTAKVETLAEPAPATVVDGPDTVLPFKLTGILFAADAEASAAIIVAAGREITYRVGDVIDSQATLHAVFADRVVLLNGERYETLRQPEELVVAAATDAVAAEQSQEILPAQLEDEIAAENVALATEVIQVAPDYVADQFVGFRVGPGPDREGFERLGLRSGDVITMLNGAAVDDPSAGVELLEDIMRDVTVSLSIVRNGTPQLVVVNTAGIRQRS